MLFRSAIGLTVGTGTFMALALGHPVGHPVDTGSQDMPCQEASGIRFVASHGDLNPEGLNGIKE